MFRELDVQRRGFGTVAAREDGHLAPGVLKFAREFFHDGRLAGAAEGEVADGDDLNAQRFVAEDADVDQPAVDFDADLVKLGTAEEDSARQFRLEIMAFLENRLRGKRFQGFRPRHGIFRASRLNVPSARSRGKAKPRSGQHWSYLSLPFWKLIRTVGAGMRRVNVLFVLSTLCLAGAGFSRAQAAMETFSIDTSQSPVLIGPGSVFAGFAITPQGAGALSNSYSGSININLSSSTIQFPGGSGINARTNGTWQPAAGGATGSAPADYGAVVQVNYPPFGFYTFDGAIRNFSLDVTSSTLPLSGTNFNGTNLIFSITSVNAALDYYSTIKAGSVALTGYATNAVAAGATLITNGTKQTLTIPVSAQFTFTVLSPNDTKIILFGQIVATNSLGAAPPLIKSIGVTNQNVVVTADNASTLSQLLVSSNLTAWAPAAGVVITTNNLGWVIFTSPANGARAFFRVQQ